MQAAKVFEMSSNVSGKVTKFNEHQAPHWLKEGGKEGSTMDGRWFWRDHVCELRVGESLKTDFQTIKRVK